MPSFAPIAAFTEALRRRAAQALLPTNWGTGELQRLDADVRERSFFSARVARTDLLEEFADRVDRVLQPSAQVRADGSPFTQGLDLASARMELKDALQAAGYQPDPEDRGTLKDLSSNRRLDLILKTNVEQAQGYGQFAQAQTEEALDLFPCWELFRAEGRNVPRDWAARWTAAAAAVGDGDAAEVFASAGRMIARKDSPIWAQLSRFGTPYPPFDFNSGMWTRDVDRETAVALGVIGDLAVITPQFRPFDLQLAA